MTEDDEVTIAYEFFKGISTNDKSYLCDFHKMIYRNGSYGYRVILQSSGHKSILADLSISNGAWKVTNSDGDISAELEWKLIAAILER